MYLCQPIDDDSLDGVMKNSGILMLPEKGCVLFQHILPHEVFTVILFHFDNTGDQLATVYRL